MLVIYDQCSLFTYRSQSQKMLQEPEIRKESMSHLDLPFLYHKHYIFHHLGLHLNLFYLLIYCVSVEIIKQNFKTSFV